MPDRPTDNPGPPSGGDPEKTLHDLLAALSNVGDDGGAGLGAAKDALTSAAAGARPRPAAVTGEADASPVQELRAALEQLFDLIRTERAEQRAEIAELEAALAQANTRIRQLEAGQRLEAPAPPPNDFNQLREAAERLRQRTQELFRDAGAVLPPVDEPEGTDSAAEETPHAGDVNDADEPSHEAEIASIEAFTKPTVLRVFPGPAGPEDDPDLEIESELAIEDDILHPPADDADEAPERSIAVEMPVVAALPVEDELPESTEQDESDDADASVGSAEAAAEVASPPADADEPGEEITARDRAEPIEIAPRPARKRRAGLRRRRIDARKLEGVDPATALRAMVTSIDEIWTANVTLDLAIALTDGGTLKVTGGHNRPLGVNWVEPGTPARTTVTATTSQLVPLFGRLELTDEQSAPLIHGPRRDADLLVGWIDRAQRLSPEPL